MATHTPKSSAHQVPSSDTVMLTNCPFSRSKFHCPSTRVILNFYCSVFFESLNYPINFPICIVVNIQGLKEYIRSNQLEVQNCTALGQWKAVELCLGSLLCSEYSKLTRVNMIQTDDEMHSRSIAE